MKFCVLRIQLVCPKHSIAQATVKHLKSLYLSEPSKAGNRFADFSTLSHIGSIRDVARQTEAFRRDVQSV